jgi:hypothetical protein
MAKEATMNTLTEAQTQKSEYTIKMEKYQARIAERNKKAGETCSAILLGCDLTKITKTQINEIQQFIKRHLTWSECERHAGFDGREGFNDSAKHLKQVELASAALRLWTEWKAQVFEAK